MPEPLPALNGPERLPASTPTHLVILLHGLGADGNDLISLADEWRQFLPNAAFISPNAPFPCDMAPYGFQWFSMLDRSAENIEAGVERAAPILNQFIDAMLARFGLDDGKLALVGFSQGTMMSLHVALRRPKPCAAVVGYSGAVVGVQKLAGELVSKPPICLIHGDADMVVPFAALEIAETALKPLGVKVDAHRRPGLGHGIDHHGLHVGIEFIAEQFGLVGKEAA
ncbi:alpha/beta fold hydrolase [bacterium]|nr:alpha/beta fold hydrolase [bacterium]